MSATAIEVRIENHLVRFTPPAPIDKQAVISQLGRSRNQWRSYQSP
jgi:hypothetical protein